MNHYETVFILNPVLSVEQAKEAVQKFKGVLKEHNAEIVSTENWGIKTMAYPIEKKSSGFYNLMEFKVIPEAIAKLETEFRRDERVMRFLTVKLDKFSSAYAERRRSKMSNKQKDN